MSKKLLSEAQVRRFQSLASIKPLQEMGSYSMKRDEDPMEEAYGDEAHMRDDETNETLYEEEEDMDMEMDMDADEEDMGDADVEIDEELVEKFMDAVETIQQVADSLGGAMGAEAEMGGDDLDLDADEEGGDDLALDAGGEEEPAEEDEEEMLQEALHGISYVPSQKEVVKLVAKRVARRLQEAKTAQRRGNRALGKKR